MWGKVLQSVWSSLQCCGIRTELDPWTWGSGMVGAKGVEVRVIRHLGRSRSYRSGAVAWERMTEQARHRTETRECPRVRSR